MKKIIFQTALFAYINSICFRNFKPSCTMISSLYNRNTITDSKSSYISHDRLQRLLQIEQKWNLYLKQKYGHLLIKETFDSNYNKASKSKRKKTFLIIDDTVIAKPFSKELDILSWLYSSGDKKYLLGLNIVFVIWTDGNTRFPIGFRLWNKNDKKSRLDLAMEILKDAKKFYKVKPSYVLMDSFYSASKLLRLIRKLRWHWITKLKPNRALDKVQIQELFSHRFSSKTGRLNDRIKAKVIKEKKHYWATSDSNLLPAIIKKYYRKRQIIEEFFKILKSELRIEGCASRSKVAQLNHIQFVLIAFCQLEDFRIRKNIETIYKVRAVMLNCIIPKNFKWKIELPKISFA